MKPFLNAALSLSLMTIIIGCAPATAPQINLTSLPDTAVTPLLATVTQAPTQTDTPSPTATATPPVEPFENQTPTLTATQTPTTTSTKTETPTITPTYAPLRGKINVDKVSCRYGPGAMYLYLYGLVKGANQDVIGRNDSGSWLLTKARGDDKSCWVKTDLMDINGDPLTAPVIHPDDYRLPQSPYYGPLTNVTAKRNGSEVIISWSPLVLRAGDDSLQTPYVLQVWVCRNGQPVFESIGSYDTTVKVIDEGGCDIQSRGRITAAEKHGYTKFTEVPWP